MATALTSPKTEQTGTSGYIKNKPRMSSQKRNRRKRKIIGPVYVTFYRNNGEVIELDWTWRPREPPRYYGTFICKKPNCNRRWESSWTWLGRRQKCRCCRKYIIPNHVAELREKSDWHGSDWHGSGWHGSGWHGSDRNFHRKPPKEPHDIEG